MKAKKRLLDKAQKGNRKVELFEISYGETYNPVYWIVETTKTGDETHSETQARVAFELIKVEILE